MKLHIIPHLASCYSALTLASLMMLTSVTQTLRPNCALAIDIELTLQEPGGITRQNEPVTSGVPLPPGAQTTTWALFDGAQQIPLQVTPLSGRTPWILLDFQIDVPASGKKTLLLRDTISAAAPAHSLALVEHSDYVVVTTGPAQFLVKKNVFNGLETVWLDSDNNGIFIDAERVATATGDTLQIVDATSGQTFSGAGAPDTFTWEYRGPLRATLRVDGRYRNGSAQFIAYTMRLSFYAGHSFVTIEHILRNSFQANERHVKISSAQIIIGAGAAAVQAVSSGSVSWTPVNADGASFEIVPTSLWGIDTSANNGMLLPDLSHHGATLIADFSTAPSSSEQTRRRNASQSPLFAMAPPSWYAAYGELSTSKFSTLAEEKASYQSWGWVWTSAQEPNDSHNPDYAISWRQVAVHEDSEADDLWQNLLMYIRTGQRGYWDRARGWARYFKWEYAFRTDSFPFAWDGNYENPKVLRPNTAIPLTSVDTTYLQNDVKPGRLDIRAWGADHLYGWGLIDYYYLTGDLEALEAARDIAEISQRVFGWRTPGEYPVGNINTRQAARHLLLLARLNEAHANPALLKHLTHLGQLMLQSPDWDTRGFYPAGAWSTDTTLGTGAYAAGARWTPVFALALTSHALERYYRASGDARARERVIAIANWAKQYGLHPTYQYAGSSIALDYPTPGAVWHNYFAKEPPTSFNPQATVWLIDSLIRGYRMTGDTSFLERARLYWDRGSKARFGVPITRTAGDNQVGRFLNGIFSSGGNYYSNNGDVTYAHLLFYDHIHTQKPLAPPRAPGDLNVR